MTEQMQTAREDLAFMRALVEDRGPLPRPIGEHFLMVGLLYGANVLYAWAGKSGFAPWPAGDSALLGWAPAAVLHIPYALWFTRRTRGFRGGPTLAVFGVAWIATVLMTAAIVASIYVAGARTGVDYVPIWPAIAVALYGGSWTVAAVARRSFSYFAVAVGCFATAVLCAALIGTPDVFLALGLGVLFFIGGPGLAIMLRAGK